MRVNFLQEQDGRLGPMSCGRARELDGVRGSAKYQAILMSLKTAKTAKNSEARRCFLRDPIGRK
jgi:hypothetical protein